MLVSTLTGICLLTLSSAVAVAVAKDTPITDPSTGATTKWKHFDCGTDIEKGSHDFKKAVDRFHKAKKGKHPLKSKSKSNSNSNNSSKSKANGDKGKGKGSGGTRLARSHLHRPRDDDNADDSTPEDGSVEEASSSEDPAASNPIDVPTYIHIITTTSSPDTISESMVSSQLEVLNAQYAPYHIHFSLQNTTHTANDAWAVGAGDDDTAMKTALRQGTYSALNLYFQTELAGNVLGRCSLPSNIGGAGADSAPGREQYVHDGCNVQAQTMPGGSVLGYNLGRTAVHETGHWLGLLHTFEGYTCDGEGDYVEDTPMQSMSTDGCPEKKDTCEESEGEDLVHNFMDYSTDACYTGFTPGQRERIQDMWVEFREGR